jgi:eukaryotic-like serine/threonine-protein kinase
MNPPDRAWVGKVLGDRWTIDGFIARGGVATVFRASDARGHLAAIKIMHPHFAEHADARSRFLREGYAANRVDHPGVVRVIDSALTQEGLPYLVMELLESGELLEQRREAAGGALHVDEVVSVADQLLDVLTSAHEKGIIHRDIKPDNLFLLSDGTVKVLDFGIAQIREAAVRAEPTRTGLLLGTPEFMSPEQALGQRGVVDAQSDLYAVGATMFTLLSGEAVHVADTLPKLLTAVVSEQARSLATVARRGIPRALVAIVDRALALDKTQRWRTAKEMREALRAYEPNMAKRPPSPISEPPPATVPTPPEPIAVRHLPDPPRAPGERRPPVAFPPPPSGRNWQSTPPIPSPVSAAPSTPRLEEEVTIARAYDPESMTTPITPRVDLAAPTLRMNELSALDRESEPSTDPSPEAPLEETETLTRPLAREDLGKAPISEHTLLLPQATPRPPRIAPIPTPRDALTVTVPRRPARPQTGPIVAILVVLGLIGAALVVAAKMLGR